MSVFEFMEDHEQIKNLHDRINNMKTIDKAHQKLNGELRWEVKSLRNDMKLKDKYICRHHMKGKEVDIDKAIHYLEMVKERDYS